MPAVTARLGRALASGRLLAVTLALPAALLAAVPAVSSTPVPPGDASTGAPAAGAPAAPATDVTETHVVRVDRRTALVATAPERVRVGRAVVVRGTVEVRAGARARKRPLVFAERRDGSWRVVRRAMSRRLGDFRVVLPGSATAGTRVLEVRAPRSSGLRAVRVRVRVAVVATTVPQAPPQPEAPGPWQADDAPRTPAPLGLPGDWGYTFAGGARWNPCRPIAWSYDPAGGYAGAIDDVRTAVDAIAERTGLTFTETGAADAPLRLMWSDEARDEALRGGVVGVARTRATATTGAEVLRRITGSTVVLDRGHALRQGHFDSGSPSWGQVITHEVLHGLGLAHARPGAGHVSVGQRAQPPVRRRRPHRHGADRRGRRLPHLTRAGHRSWM